MMMKQKKGFSLIELMVALSLIILLIFAAVPAWRMWLAEKRSQTYAEKLARAIALARSEAILRAQPIKFCKSKDGRHCGGDWRDGQIILDDSDTLVRAFEGLPPGDELIWRSNFGWNEQLVLLPNGFTKGQQGRFYYCPRDKLFARALVVEESGRTRVEKTDCADVN